MHHNDVVYSVECLYAIRRTQNTSESACNQRRAGVHLPPQALLINHDYQLCQQTNSRARNVRWTHRVESGKSHAVNTQKHKQSDDDDESRNLWRVWTWREFTHSQGDSRSDAMQCIFSGRRRHRAVTTTAIVVCFRCCCFCCYFLYGSRYIWWLCKIGMIEWVRCAMRCISTDLRVRAVS